MKYIDIKKIIIKIKCFFNKHEYDEKYEIKITDSADIMYLEECIHCGERRYVAIGSFFINLFFIWHITYKDMIDNINDWLQYKTNNIRNMKIEKVFSYKKLIKEKNK